MKTTPYTIFTVSMRWSLLAALCCALTGCGGGGSKTTVTNRTTTVGQELIDLKSALDSGAISHREYEEQKENILDGE